MQSTATSGRIAATAVARPRRPSWRRVMGIALTATILLGLSSVASTVAYLRVPDPTGSRAIGKSAAMWPSGDTLRGAPGTVFGHVTAPTDVQVFVYPLER